MGTGGALLVCLWFPWSGEPTRQQIVATPPVIHQRDGGVDPDWAIVFSFMRTKCLGCHLPNTERHDLSSLRGILGPGPSGDAPIVIPGNLEESPLWDLVVWNHAESAQSPHPDKPEMPPDKKDWLTAGQLAALKRWIERGCPTQRPGRAVSEIDFPSAKECAHCHPKQFEEWSRSMHAYAQHSPVMEAFTLTLLERTGGTLGTFCTRCHTPIGISLGESAQLPNHCRSRIAMEGVTCVVCHRMQQPYYKASGRLPVQPGQVLTTCLYGPFDNPVPIGKGSHPSDQNNFLLTSKFCGTCHDVTSPNGVRLEEAFSEWQNSPAAKDNQNCQSCHMGPVPGLSIPREQRPWGKAAQVPGVDPSVFPDRPLANHSFAGPDYSLLPDTEFPHKLDWMYETDYRNDASLTSVQRETLRELRIRNRKQLIKADWERYTLLRNGAEISVTHPECARAGKRIHIDVAVTSKTAGHNFPTGFTAERQVWVEIVVYSPQGEVVFVSGDVDANGDLRDEHSHAVEAREIPYDRHLLNLQSKFIALGLQGTERSVVIPVNRNLAPLNVIRPANHPAQTFGRPGGFRIAKGSIPPLKTAHGKYSFRLPKSPGTYSVRVRLNFRNLPPVLFDKIGIPHLKHLLETFVIDEYYGTIQVE